jgi:hypothetical protein
MGAFSVPPSISVVLRPKSFPCRSCADTIRLGGRLT